jgi:Zn-dependent peptidase ImmA (M78 family)
MTKVALAAASNLTVRSITAYESGSHPPSDETLVILSRVLSFPSTFFQGSDIDVPNVDGASFRALASMTAAQRDMALAAGALAILVSHWIDARFQLPASNVPNMHSLEPEAAAQSLRREWGLGERPIQNMLHLLEANGVRVFSLPRDSESVNAFSVWHGPSPYVFLTTDKSGERGRFDCAHELGHLTLHQKGGPRSRQAEMEADQFASAFLMPQSSVLAVAPRNPTLQTLISLKKRWLVSVGALVHRLRALGMLTEWQYRTLWIEISERGFRKNEPNGISRESSQVLAKVFDLLRKQRVPRDTIARDLCIEMNDLDSLIFVLAVSSIPGGRIGQGSTGPPSRDKLRLLR